MTKKKRTADSFSFADLAHAAGVSKRDIQHVMDRHLLPEGSGMYRLNRMAVVGGFVSAGVPLLLSTKIANAIAVQFEAAEVPTGLRQMSQQLSMEDSPLLPGDCNDFWYHRAIFRHAGYVAGQAKEDDVLIVIVDRTTLFIGAHGRIFAHDFKADCRLPAQFVGWIDGWERGAKAEFHLRQNSNGVDDDDGEADDHQRIYINAVGKMVVNVSLAVRNALDRLADHRLAPKVKPGTNGKLFAPRSKYILAD